MGWTATRWTEMGEREGEETEEQIVRRKERKERKKERSISCTWSTPAALKNCMIPFFTSSSSYFISSSDFLLSSLSFFYFSPFPFFLYFSFLSLFLPLFFLFPTPFDPGRVERGLRIELIEYVMYDWIHTFSFMIPVILSSFSLSLYSLLTFEKEERNEVPVTLYDGEIWAKLWSPLKRERLGER